MESSSYETVYTGGLSESFSTKLLSSAKSKVTSSLSSAKSKVTESGKKVVEKGKNVAKKISDRFGWYYFYFKVFIALVILYTMFQIYRSF